MGSGEPPGSWYWPWLSKDSSQSSPLESRYLSNLQLLMMTLFHVTNYCVIIIKPPSAVIFLDFVSGSCWVVHSLHVCWLLHWQSGGHLCRAAGLVSWYFTSTHPLWIYLPFLCVSTCTVSIKTQHSSVYFALRMTPVSLLDSMLW